MSDVLKRFAATIPKPAPADGGEGRALDRLRAELAQNPAATAEGARLQSELDALERDRRAAAARAGGPSADQVQSIERRAGELDAALQRFGRI